MIAAIKRFADALNLEAVNVLIDAIPEEAYGIFLMPEPMREEHKQLLKKRWEEGILPLV